MTNGESPPPPANAADAAAEFERARVPNYAGVVLPVGCEYWFEEGSRRFWWRNDKGHWGDFTMPEIERELRKMGVRSKKEEGERISPLDEVIRNIQLNRRVWYAGALAGYLPGIYEMQARRILVTHGPKLIAPVRGDWPLLGKFFENFLSDAESKIDQRAHFFAWLQQGLRCVYTAEWLIPGGLALGLCGPTECGKSLLIGLLTELFGGRIAKPWRYMIGEDDFNEDIFEACLQVVDDESSDTSIKGRLHLAAEIKKMVAVDGLRCRGMHKKALVLRPLLRLVIACNDGPDRLLVLPPLDDDIQDKLLLLKAYKRPFPWPCADEAEKMRSKAALLAELPGFVWWLLNEFQMPSALAGRFGVRAWQHPEIVQALLETSPELRLWHFVERVLGKRAFEALPGTDYGNEGKSADGRLAVLRGEAGKPARWRWRGTTQQLEAELKSETGGLSFDERKEVPKPAWIGRRLQKLAEVVTTAEMKPRHTDGGTEWTLRNNLEGLPE